MAPNKFHLLKDNWAGGILIASSITAIFLKDIGKLNSTSILTFTLLIVASLGVNQVLANSRLDRKLDSLYIDLHPVQAVDVADFYRILNSAVQSAQHHIDLTLHQAFSPEILGLDSCTAYFSSIDKEIRKNGRLRIRRIVTVPNQNRLDLVEVWMRRYEACSNFHLAITESYGATLAAIPLSLQIIDETVAFIANIGVGSHDIGTENKSLVIYDKQLIAHLQRYYDAYWSGLPKLKLGLNIDRGLFEDLRAGIGAG